MRAVLEQALYSGGVRGVGVYTRGLAAGLAVLSEARAHEFLLFGFCWGDFERRRDSVPAPSAPWLRRDIRRWPESLVTRAEWGWGLPVIDAYCRGVGASVYHCPGMRVPRLRRARTVLTVHDLVPAILPEVLPPGASGPWLENAKACVERADLVLVDSETTRADLLRLTGCDPGKLRQVYLGIDHALFRPLEDPAARAATRARFGLPERYLISTGPWEHRRNLPTELKALEILRSRAATADLGLALVGEPSGDYGAGLRRLVAERGLEGAVRWTGWVSNEDLRALYASAAAFVYPSWYDGYNMPMHEAMACGCLAAVSDAGVLPELGRDACLYFPPADAEAMADRIARLLEDSALAAELRAKGFARAGEFRWERCAAGTLKALLEAAGGGA